MIIFNVAPTLNQNRPQLPVPICTHAPQPFGQLRELLASLRVAKAGVWRILAKMVY